MLRSFINFKFVLILCLCVYGNENAPQVEVEQGILKGKFFKTRQGREFAGFMSIPYAKAPVGDLRFQPPVPGEPWKGILDATKVHPMCPQKDAYKPSEAVLGDENCLYLNVYTPKLPDVNNTTFPVLVFIHGGGYFTGCGNYHCYGPGILLDRDVVLVVFNYRLGALGFFSTGDDTVTGNNGLKDQNLALKWIRKNIAKFGGNPEKITIFGESSGASSVHLHMLSPASRGLFQGAISQSGTALLGWAIDLHSEVTSNSRKLANMLNCSNTSSQKMTECLRKLDFSKFVDPKKPNEELLSGMIDRSLSFKPTIEPKVQGAFLTERPKDIIRSNRSSNVPWIIGMNTEEGAVMASILYKYSNLIDFLEKNFRTIAPELLDYKNEVRRDEISEKIRQFYFGNSSIDDSTRLDLIDMFTDGKFLRGLDETVRLHMTHSKQPLYYYLFGYRGVASYSELYGNNTKNYGVSHGDELQYLFPICETLFPGKKADVFDLRITKELTTLWANFAKTGNPTPEFSEFYKPQWVPVLSENMERYYIGSNIHMGTSLLKKRAKFWRTLFRN